MDGYPIVESYWEGFIVTLPNGEEYFFDDDDAAYDFAKKYKQSNK